MTFLYHRQGQGGLPARFWVLGVLLVLLLAACVNLDPLDAINRTFEDLIAQIGEASGNWEEIARSLIQDLPEDVQNRIDELIQRAVSAVGAEVSCRMDIIRDALQQDLRAIWATLRGEDPPARPPRFCSAVPQNINLGSQPNTIVFAGYNFDDDVSVQLVDTRGRVSNVASRFITRNSNYNITVNLSTNGLQLNTSAQELRLNWQNTEIGAAAITVPSCQQRTATVASFTDGITPRHTRGDREFDGNGPRVTIRVNVFNFRDHLEYQIYMKAEEWENGRPRSDFTTAEESTGRRRANYSPPPGWEIIRIDTATSGSLVTTLSGHGDSDNFHSRPGNGPVSLFRIVGDTGGDEAGTETRVEVRFVQLRVTIRQTENCNP